MFLTAFSFPLFAAAQTALAYRKVVVDKRNALLSIPFTQLDNARGEDFDEEKGKAYQALFESVKTSELQSLAEDPDVSLSLQARWEMARNPIRRNPPMAEYSDWIYDPNSLDGFLKFFSKRVGYQPPSWWSSATRHVDLFPGRHSAIEAPDKGQSNLTGKQPGISVTEKGEFTTLSDGKHKIVLAHRYGETGYFVVFDAGRAYVENYNPIASYPSLLTCFSLSNGKEIWSRPVWGNHRGDFGGWSFHMVSMQLEGKDITVFGTQFGSYAECFKTMDGAPVFKFCSTYWFNFPETWHVPWNQKSPGQNWRLR